jgi:mannose-1-phosphate guanylyltransferase
MLQETFHRVYPEIERERIFIVAGEHLKGIIGEQLPEINEYNLIVEPVGKNTAAAIGLAAAYIGKRDPRATVAVLSADHVVDPKNDFLNALQAALKVSSMGYIVTFGVKPSRPATEFGYIEVEEEIPGNFDHEVYTVKNFREKPSLEQAKIYIEQGTFLWNSGMFIFEVSLLFEALKRHMPVLHRGLLNIQDSIGTRHETAVKREEFEKFESISIDYGVMEKFDRIASLKPKFNWDDVGSWSALERHLQKDENGNIVRGNAVTVDSSDNIIIGDATTLISLVGIEGTIVVKEGNRILLCRKSMDQKVKKLLKEISLERSTRKFL